MRCCSSVFVRKDATYHHKNASSRRSVLLDLYNSPKYSSIFPFGSKLNLKIQIRLLGRKNAHLSWIPTE
jgi:hypothetical protein